jgi:plasmid stabilization system protein ParE
VRYRLTNHSEVTFDFAAILDLIGNYAGYSTARRKVATIHDTIKNLRDYPHTGVAHPEIMPNLRMTPSGDKAVICFTVDDDAHVVRIICVTYAGQDWQRIARERQER